MLRKNSLTALFGNMRTLKFRGQSTNAFFASFNQMLGGSPHTTTTAEHCFVVWTVLHDLNAAPSVIVGRWKEPPDIFHWRKRKTHLSVELWILESTCLNTVALHSQPSELGTLCSQVVDSSTDLKAGTNYMTRGLFLRSLWEKKGYDQANCILKLFESEEMT